MSRDEYMDSTQRELIALNIGNAEMNGAKTEYDNIVDDFS